MRKRIILLCCSTYVLALAHLVQVSSRALSLVTASGVLRYRCRSFGETMAVASEWALLSDTAAMTVDAVDPKAFAELLEKTVEKVLCGRLEKTVEKVLERALKKRRVGEPSKEDYCFQQQECTPHPPFICSQGLDHRPFSWWKRKDVMYWTFRAAEEGCLACVEHSFTHGYVSLQDRSLTSGFNALDWASWSFENGNARAKDVVDFLEELAP